MKIMTSLSPADRSAINSRMEQHLAESQAKSQKEIQEIYRKAEADGTLEKIRKLAAQDKARKSKKKSM